jgi:hypothetical protein
MRRLLRCRAWYAGSPPGSPGNYRLPDVRWFYHAWILVLASTTFQPADVYGLAYLQFACRHYQFHPSRSSGIYGA